MRHKAIFLNIAQPGWCKLDLMAIDYAESRVREALEISGGNKAKARKLLLEWVHSDHQLLLGLTGLHLNGIIPYWVERVKRKESLAAKAAAKIAGAAGTTGARAGKKSSAAAPAKQKKPENFGKEMLKSFAGQNTAVFGLEAGSAPLRKKNASQRHIDAINLIAGKNGKKRDS